MDFHFGSWSTCWKWQNIILECDINCTIIMSYINLHQFHNFNKIHNINVLSLNYLDKPMEQLKQRQEMKPSKIQTSSNEVTLATSHAFWFAHICILRGLYVTNTFFARDNIDNHNVFTFWKIFKPFTSDKKANLSSSKTFLPNWKK